MYKAIITKNQHVFEVFKEKHPEPGENVESAFIQCGENDLPDLVDIDVTANDVESVAKKMSGSGGPSRTDADQWRSFLLRFGSASLRLREACGFFNSKKMPIQLLNGIQFVPWWRRGG